MAPARRPPSSSSSSSTTSSQPPPPPPPAPYQAPSFSRPFSRYPSFKQADSDHPDNGHPSARGITPEREGAAGLTGLPPPPPPPGHHQHSAAIPPPQRYHHTMPAPASNRQHANLIMRRPANNGYTGVPMSFSRGGVDQQAQEDSDEIPGDDDEEEEDEEGRKQAGAPQPYQHQHAHQQPLTGAYPAQQSYPGIPPSTQPPRQQSYPHSYPQHQAPPAPSNGKHRKTSTSASSTGSQTAVGVAPNVPNMSAGGASPGATGGGSSQPPGSAGKSASPGKTTKKRDRISQACNFCRQRRMKCRGGRPVGANYPSDPGQPCDRCAEKGSECSWSCYSDSGRQATTARKKSRLSGAPLPESLTGGRYDGATMASGSNSGTSTPSQSRQKTGGAFSPGESAGRGNRNASRRRTLEAAASAREESGYGPETQSQDSQALAVHAALQYHLEHRGDVEDPRPQPLTMEVGAPSGTGRDALQPRAIVPDGTLGHKRKRSDQEASAALMMMPHIDPALGGSGGAPLPQDAHGAKRGRAVDPENTYSNGAVPTMSGPLRPSVYSRGVVPSRKTLSAAKARPHGYASDTGDLATASTKKESRRRNSIAGGVSLSDLAVLSLIEEHKARASDIASAMPASLATIKKEPGKLPSFERSGLGPDTPMSAPAAAEDYLGEMLLPVSPLIVAQVADVAPRGISQRRKDVTSGFKIDHLELDDSATLHDILGYAVPPVAVNGGVAGDPQQYANIDPSLGPSASQMGMMPPLSQTSFKPSSDSQLEPWFDIGGAGMPSQQSQQLTSQHYSHHPYHQQSAPHPYGYSQVGAQTAGWPYATASDHSPQQAARGTSASAYPPYAQQLPYSHYRYTSTNLPTGSPGSYAASTPQDAGNYYPLPAHGEGSLSQLADMSLARFGNLSQSQENDGQMRRSSSVSSLTGSQGPATGARGDGDALPPPPSQAEADTGLPREPLIEYGTSQSQSQGQGRGDASEGAQAAGLAVGDVAAAAIAAAAAQGGQDANGEKMEE
ncbi:hypothetical protein BCV69DRAFT_312901 [Microstroma glucosiphilum]|uniref:Zn(2)-C6 fungal-type domain-containing protein n=1 Tax=Pseudomicrostroma glucosiphilum TaxID=1684307 RepID=A0A316U4Z6_9BASI|nr:hypothetical protein BCV69DRAFT_312901 [Pseudomicrostroma glucosiphilum]PWN20306.1 hypothetical protein BCV69DRAFT_312901 [Pseudomicrostroma glucosiphilum]